ncbi:hypothetical protein DFH11DRAFT_1036457 [Phellopilus nigrolimitatus]|nr:hypothetical protein DFH11DRAFT_1036457 [Phellopilus nigrolimitatus]
MLGHQQRNQSLPALVPASFHESDDEDAEQGHVPFDIHQYFGLSPGTPICLDSLQDPPPGHKPAYTYATLVKLAIWSSPQRRLTLAGIYEALESRFPWFKQCENPNAWKTSIRHSLSLLSVFIKLPIDIHLPGKSHYWTVDFTKGDGYKRPRKRGKKPLRGDLDSPLSSIHTIAPPPFHSKRRSPPSGAPKSYVSHPEDWQGPGERANRVFAPYGKSIQLAAASPEPQFRHYRMCTYLYPDTNGTAVPTSATQIWNILDHQKQLAADDMQDHSEDSTNGGGQGTRQRRHVAQAGADPLVDVSHRGAVGPAHGRYASFPSTGDVRELAEGEYFHPSPASYQAYHTASSASRSPYSWDANSSSSNKTLACSEGDSTTGSREYREYDFVEEGADEERERPPTVIRRRLVAGDIIDPSFRTSRSADEGVDRELLEPPLDMASSHSDFEEEELC